jgi:hypothetical protein
MSPKAIRCATPLISSLLFILMGFAFIPQAGIHNDEALFSSGIYQQLGIAHGIKIFGHRIPVMLMSYLGCLKSWIYAPIFRFWKPSTFSLRVPVILAAATTIWLFWSLLCRIAGYRAATAGSALLASDTLFLMTSCFDWGPVVLQHLLLVSGALCLVRFHQERTPRFLAAGFFLFGLALWDKALFAWILSGMVVAAVLALSHELWKSLNLRNLFISATAFCLGAAPLIFYNVFFPLETFRSNAAFDSSDAPGKNRMLLSTFSGTALFGFIPRSDAAGHPRDPHGMIENISIRISDLTAGQPAGFFGYALLVAALLFPLLWRTPARKPMAFAFIAMAVAWIEMLYAKGAGGSVHHAILLWPFPALFVSVAFAEASRRIGPIGMPLLAAVLVYLVGANLLVTNEYFARLVRNGGGETWTDAIYPLSDSLRRVKARTIYINDWGILDVLRMLNRGRLPLRVGSHPLSKPQLDAEDRRMVWKSISEPESIFVGHTDAAEQFGGVNAKLRALAEEAGYRREMVAEIADRNGRPIFEVFRFERAPDCGDP